MLSYSRVKDFWLLLDDHKDFKSLTDPKLLWGDLKEYQRLFILDHLLKLPRGSRIVEIGGGVCNVFEALLDKFPGGYECWSIDPLDGQGGGPQFDNLPRSIRKNVRIIRESIGSTSTNVPDNYFDLLFSLSVMEHIPVEEWEKCFADMVRICKPGALIIHTIDGSVDFPVGEQYMKVLKEMPKKMGLRLLDPHVSFDVPEVKNDPETLYVSPTAYMQWLRHFPPGRNTLRNGIFCRVTAFNAIYVKL